MIKLLSTLLLIFMTFILISCSSYTNKKNYRFAKDGLVYNSHNDELYTGEIIDTSDVIIRFDVVKGKKNGTFAVYYLDGNIEKFGFIKDNKNEGEWKYYYPNGNIETIGKFEKDNPQGNWISYYPDGQPKAKGDYLKGKQHGRWFYYNEKGEIIYVLVYQNGVFVDMQDRNV